MGKTWLSSLFGLALLAGACQGEPPPRPRQALVEPTSPALEPSSEERPGAVLTRIDVYGAAGQESVGSRVVLTFDGAPLFHQKQLPAEGILPPRVWIELEDTMLGESVPVSQSIDSGGLERVRLASPNPRVVLDLQPLSLIHI